MSTSVWKEPRHGNPRFPLGVYRNQSQKGGSLLYPHWHDEVEFFCLTSGCATFRIDARCLQLEAGEAVFIRSGEIHSAQILKGMDSSFSAIVFDPAYLLSAYSSLGVGNSLLPLFHGTAGLFRILSPDTPWGAEVLHRLDSIVALYEESASGHELGIIGELYGLFSSLVRHGQIQPVESGASLRTSERQERLKKAILFIQQRYRESIGLEECAAASALSPYYFCRLFRQMTGCSPFEYLERYRMEQALGLLESTDKRIKEIADEVGFESASYFIKVFRKHYGRTPIAYRRGVAPGLGLDSLLHDMRPSAGSPEAPSAPGKEADLSS